MRHLSYSVFDFIFSLFFRFWAVRLIKLAIPSAFERTLIYRIVSYRLWSPSNLIAFLVYVIVVSQSHRKQSPGCHFS